MCDLGLGVLMKFSRTKDFDDAAHQAMRYNRQRLDIMYLHNHYSSHKAKDKLFFRQKIDDLIR